MRRKGWEKSGFSPKSQKNKGKVNHVGFQPGRSAPKAIEDTMDFSKRGEITLKDTSDADSGVKRHFISRTTKEGGGKNLSRKVWNKTPNYKKTLLKKAGGMKKRRGGGSSRRRPISVIGSLETGKNEQNKG